MVGRLKLRNCWSWALLAVLALVCALTSSGRAEASGSFNVLSEDVGACCGSPHSLALDSAGNPVISEWWFGAGALEIVHCNDPDCLGGDESSTFPASGGQFGGYTSLVLDAAGNPVVSFYDDPNGDLKLLHCNDPDCVGGDDSVNSPDTTGTVGRFTSVVLDATGNPVIVYQDLTNLTLKVAHCNDPDCAGGDESVTTPDAASTISPSSSRAVILDAVGNPVIAYSDFSNEILKLMHCNDPDCAGGDESIVLPDPGAEVVAQAITLDVSGSPVIAYRAHVDTHYEIMVLHCDDPDCNAGGDSITAPVSFVLGTPSVVLDEAGYPVVTFDMLSPSSIASPSLMHCNDINCSGGDESVESFDTISNAGVASFLLDPFGVPVLVYRHYQAVVVHCADAYCTADFDGDGCADVNEQNSDGATLTFGGLRNPKNPYDYFNPSHDHQNRVDDILLVVDAYFHDDTDGTPGLPPYATGYTPDTDRTLIGPNAWNLGPPNGLQRIDDILNAVHQYFHDCA